MSTDKEKLRGILRMARQWAETEGMGPIRIRTLLDDALDILATPEIERCEVQEEADQEAPEVETRVEMLEKRVAHQAARLEARLDKLEEEAGS
jgi:hypothetical protein